MERKVLDFKKLLNRFLNNLATKKVYKYYTAFFFKSKSKPKRLYTIKQYENT